MKLKSVAVAEADITRSEAWEALMGVPKPAHLRELFAADPQRAEPAGA